MKKIFICLIICLFLSACQSNENYVYYEGVAIDPTKLSAGALEWLEMYNSFMEEDSELYIDYIHPEIEGILKEKGVLDEIRGQNTVIFETSSTVVTKVLKIEENRFLISTDDLYWCVYEDVDKLKEGYVVEIIYDDVVGMDNRLEINPNSVTIISGTYNYIGLYLDIVDELLKEDLGLSEISSVIVNLSSINSLSDTDKQGLLYLLNSTYDIVFKNGVKEDKLENDLFVNFYIWPDSEDENALFYIDARIESEAEYVKYSKCPVKSVDNQLIFEKNVE